MNSLEFFGILNVTPDSFSGDGIMDPTEAIRAANQMFIDGASYIDVGAASTRPGAEVIEPDEEWRRLRPLLNELVFAHPGHISIDTYNPETVERCAAEIGDFIINNVASFNNPRMIEVAGRLRLPVIISHLPEAMGDDIQAAHQPKAKIDSMEQVKHELLAKRQQLIACGLTPETITIDPGIGFGKTPDLNFRLLAFAAEVPGIDVMIGYSKKGFLGQEMAANLEAGRIAVESGARYLRLHGDLLTRHRQAFRA